MVFIVVISFGFGRSDFVDIEEIFLVLFSEYLGSFVWMDFWKWISFGMMFFFFIFIGIILVVLIVGLFGIILKVLFFEV